MLQVRENVFVVLRSCAPQREHYTAVLSAIAEIYCTVCITTYKALSKLCLKSKLNVFFPEQITVVTFDQIASKSCLVFDE